MCIVPAGCSIATEGTNQGSSTRRCRHSTTQDLFRCYRAAVIGRDLIPLSAQPRTFQGSAGKQALAPAISVNGRKRENAAFSGPANRPGGSTESASELDIAAAREGVDGRLRIENDDKFGDFTTDLEPEAAAAGGDRRRATPATAPQPRNHHSVSKSAADSKSPFQDPKNGNSFGIAKHAPRNCGL